MRWLEESDRTVEEMCQPCGDCNRCQNRARAKRIVNRLRKAMPSIERRLRHIRYGLILEDHIGSIIKTLHNILEEGEG